MQVRPVLVRLGISLFAAPLLAGGVLLAGYLAVVLPAAVGMNEGLGFVFAFLPLMFVFVYLGGLLAYITLLALSSVVLKREQFEALFAGIEVEGPPRWLPAALRRPFELASECFYPKRCSPRQ